MSNADKKSQNPKAINAIKELPNQEEIRVKASKKDLESSTENLFNPFKNDMSVNPFSGCITKITTISDIDDQDFPKISKTDSVVDSLTKLVRECMGEFKLSKFDVDEVVTKVNSKGYGNWNWIELGEELEVEMYDSNWCSML